MSEEAWVREGEALARQCGGAGVLESQLGQLVAHLKRRQDLASTRALLERLVRSTFASRTGSTRQQYEALARHAGPVLQRSPTWQDAAQTIAWAKRLLPLHRAERVPRPSGAWR